MTPINVAESVCVVGHAIETSENAYFSKRKKHQRIELKTYDSICFLKEGSVSLYRLENGILTVSLDAPAILGLAQMRNEFKSHYLRCNNDCDLWVISVDDAISLFNTEHLWMHAFDILTHHLQLYFQRENLVSHPKTGDIVKEHLRFIWAMPETERKRTSIYSYIQARNHISRSAIHKEIQTLSRSGNIQIEKGKLTKFNEQDMPSDQSSDVITSI